MSDIILGDCVEQMLKIPEGYVNLTLTDIPYNGVTKTGEERAKYLGQLRKLDKQDADILKFDLDNFLKEVWRVTNGTIIIFCGHSQFSEIFNFFKDKQEKKMGTVRQLVWAKTNPSPMNGEFIYLSAVENAIWFRKSNATFNARCKKNYFIYPAGRSKLHPTEKNHELLRELILDNSSSGEIVFDPCMGSGSHLLVANQEGRRILGIELSEEYFKIANERLTKLNNGNDGIPPNPKVLGILPTII